MSDTDDDYTPPEESIDSPPAKNLRRRTARPAPEVVPARTAEKARNETHSTRVRIPDNLRSVSALKKSLVPRLRGSDITESLSLRVCRAALSMQEDYLLERRKCASQKDRQVKPAKIRERVCKLFGISAPTFSTIISSYLKDRTIYSSGKFDTGRSGNRTSKDTRIPDTKQVQIRVREFVRSRRAKRKRVTARQVLEFLYGEDVVHIKVNAEGEIDPTSFSTAYRNVRRWLQKNSYNRGRRTGNLIMKESVILHKHS